MKNSLVPLIAAAVVAGLAVVLVWQRGKRVEVQEKRHFEYCVFPKDMKQGDVIDVAKLGVRKAPAEYAPKRALLQSNIHFLKGRQLVRDVPAGEYIVPADVEETAADRVEPADQANTLVTVRFSDTTTGGLIREGTSLILMGVGTRRVVRAGQELGSEQVSETLVLSAVLKRPVLVRQVLAGGSSVLLEVPMADAQTLLCAQREREIYPWIVRDNCPEAEIPDEVTWSELCARLDAAPVRK